MSDAYASLLGPPTVVVDGTRHVLPLTRPVCFYSYLAFRRDWVARDELAYLFRPDAAEGVAKHYIRNLIHRTRALPSGFLLETRRDHCRLRIDTDVARFYGALEHGCWREAVTCYQGHLLQGLNAKEAPDFANWLELRRTELESAWHRASLMYAHELEAAERNAEAVDILDRLLHHDAFNEQALRAFVRNAALVGQRTRALEAGERFVQDLRDEFGIDPEEATMVLLDHVRRVEALNEPNEGVTRRPLRRWSDSGVRAPDEAADIALLLRHPEHRLLTILESERIGEPMLLVARRAKSFDSAVWATMNLAEALIDRRHFRRVTELLTLIAPYRSLDPHLERRFDAAVRALERHVPRRRIDALLEN